MVLDLEKAVREPRARVACSFNSGHPAQGPGWLRLPLELLRVQGQGRGWGTPVLFVSTPLPCDVTHGRGGVSSPGS